MPKRRRAAQRIAQRPLSAEELSGLFSRISLQRTNSVVVVRVLLGNNAETTKYTVRAEGKDGETRAYAKSGRRGASKLQRSFKSVQRISGDEWTYSTLVSEDTKKCREYILSLASEAVTSAIRRGDKKSELLRRVRRLVQGKHGDAVAARVYAQGPDDLLDKAPLAEAIEAAEAAKAAEALRPGRLMFQTPERPSTKRSKTNSENAKRSILGVSTNMELEIIDDPAPHFHIWLKSNAPPLNTSNIRDLMQIQLTTRYRARQAFDDENLADMQTGKQKLFETPSGRGFRRALRSSGMNIPSPGGKSKRSIDSDLDEMVAALARERRISRKNMPRLAPIAEQLEEMKI